MNNKIKNLILISSLTLITAGCATSLEKPELPASTLVRNQLVLVTLPDNLFDIPDNIKPLDVDKATQREVADWVLQNEKRTNILENKLLELRRYFVSTYDLLISNSENVIVIDTTKSEEFNKKTIEEANKKPVVVPAPQKTEETKESGFLETIKGWFGTKTEEKPVEPTVVQPK